MTDDASLGAILPQPANPAPKLVYADWLDEHGRGSEAFCWRWMARKGKRPGRRLHYVLSNRAVPARFGWGWWREGAADDPPPPAHAMLPRVLFHALPRTPWFRVYHYYATFPQAVGALGEALGVLREVLGV